MRKSTGEWLGPQRGQKQNKDLFVFENGKILSNFESVKEEPAEQLIKLAARWQAEKSRLIESLKQQLWNWKTWNLKLNVRTMKMKSETLRKGLLCSSLSWKLRELVSHSSCKADTADLVWLFLLFSFPLSSLWLLEFLFLCLCFPLFLFVFQLQSTLLSINEEKQQPASSSSIFRRASSFRGLLVIFLSPPSPFSITRISGRLAHPSRGFRANIISLPPRILPWLLPRHGSDLHWLDTLSSSVVLFSSLAICSTVRASPLVPPPPFFFFSFSGARLPFYICFRRQHTLVRVTFCLGWDP